MSAVPTVQLADQSGLVDQTVLERAFGPFLARLGNRTADLEDFLTQLVQLEESGRLAFRLLHDVSFVLGW